MTEKQKILKNGKQQKFGKKQENLYKKWKICRRISCLQL